MCSKVIAVWTLGFIYISDTDLVPSTVVATAPVPSPAVVLTASEVSISIPALPYLATNVTTAPEADVTQLGYCAASTWAAILFTVESAATTVTPSNTKVSPAAQVLAKVTVKVSFVPPVAFQGKNAQSPAYNLPSSVKPGSALPWTSVALSPVKKTVKYLLREYPDIFQIPMMENA